MIIIVNNSSIIAKDAYLGVRLRSSARRDEYHAYVGDFRQEQSITNFYETGMYVGEIYKHCFSRFIAVDGSCRKWDIKFKFKYRVEEI